MPTFRNISKIQLLVWLSGFLQLYHCLSNVKMEVSVQDNYMTLSCLVAKRESRKNIYLNCPLDKLHCLENCISSCQEEDCRVGDLIKCQEKGFHPQTNVYRIDYVIDGTKIANNGNWRCQYGGESSSNIRVNVTSTKKNIPTKLLITTKQPPDSNLKPQIENNPVLTKESMSSNVEDLEAPIKNDKIFTRSEFIITVIGLLAFSLILNIYFCCKMIIIHCRDKKKDKNASKYLLSNTNHPPYNHSNSQVSDLERIYEDTTFNPRQMSFLTQIKNSNGAYLAPSTLSPSVFSTLIPHPHFNRSLSIPNSVSESGSQQHPYPILTDPSQSNYTTVTFPTENNYTNFVSVQPEMCLQNGSTIHQPVYLAFQSPHGLLTAGNRYVHYGNQPLQSVATISDGSNTFISPMSHSSSIDFPNVSEEGKSNYQLSREMMEEADNLLRTADTLLKSTENQIKFYQQ